VAVNKFPAAEMTYNVAQSQIGDYIHNLLSTFNVELF